MRNRVLTRTCTTRISKSFYIICRFRSDIFYLFGRVDRLIRLFQLLGWGNGNIEGGVDDCFRYRSFL